MKGKIILSVIFSPPIRPFIVILIIFSRAVQTILEAGADPNAQDEFSTPFKTAARQHKRVMEGRSSLCYRIIFV